MSDHPNITLAGVTLTHPDRVLYPEQGATKRALADYYIKVADWILPYVAQRPLSLVRCPAGRQQCFFQKNYDGSFPEAVKGVALTENDGERATYFTIQDRAGLVALVQMGVLELHPWGSRNDQLEYPDQLIFDLDPGPKVDWQAVLVAARQVRERLEALGLHSFVKTSGGKGLHVLAPLERSSTWEEAGDFAEAFARQMAQDEPQRFLATAAKSGRQGKIYLDYLRNRRGATSVAPYSSRARAGAPVSTPLRWDELSGLESATAYTIENVPRRLAALKSNPWEDFFDLQQSITPNMKKKLGLPTN